jgi:hypothetical protein
MEWLYFRSQGIGGSEIGAVLNISRWHDALRVHMNKIGEDAGTFSGNRYTRFGKYHEEHTIAPMYQYWDHSHPGEERMFMNMDAKYKINRVRKVNAYIINEKYPWLFGSIDRKILPKYKGGEVGILEAKNTTKMEQDAYELGFNQDFYAQVQDYLLLTEWDYADIAMHTDGNDFHVVRVLPDQRWHDWIIEKSYAFWQNVLHCRKIKEEYGIDKYYMANERLFPVEAREAIGLLQSLEPETTGLESELELVQELIKPTPTLTRTVADDRIKQMTFEYWKASQEAKAAEALKTKHQTNIIRWLGGIHRAEAPDGFWVSFAPNINGIRSINYNRPYVEGKIGTDI